MSGSAPADRYDGFIVDLDGVVWVGDDAVPGAADAIAELRRRGRGVLFVTNDPAWSRSAHRAKLARLGVPATDEDVLTAGRATALHLAEERDARGRRAFVAGSAALRAELIDAGILVEDAAARDVDFVVVGGHTGFDYAELRAAARLVRGGAELYATGRDPTFPMPDGPWPATGAVLAAVEAASGATATVIGKPERYMFEEARRLLPGRARLAVVGDRVDSDVEGGRRAGLATVLVWPGPEPASGGADVVVPDLASLLVTAGASARQATS
jgi:glycerol 3-phosphatase-2